MLVVVLILCLLELPKFKIFRFYILGKTEKNAVGDARDAAFGHNWSILRNYS